MEAKNYFTGKVSFNAKKEIQNSLHRSPIHHPHRPPHPPHHHEYGLGAGLIGVPTSESPLFCLFEHKEDFESTMEVITCEGPGADQVRSAIIIRLLELVYAQTSEIDIPVQEGIDITSFNHMGYSYQYPIDFPTDLFESLGNEAKKVLELTSEGPRHRVEFDLLLIKGLHRLLQINNKNE